jgi:MFS family permease
MAGARHGGRDHPSLGSAVAVAVFPLIAAIVALVFAGLLFRQYLSRRRPYQLAWALALLMYTAASGALFLGVLSGWTTTEYRVYWLFGAVLNVPFLALGEAALLIRNRTVVNAAALLMVFATAFATTRIRTATIDPSALATDLPSGKDVFRADPFATDLARFYAFPAYFLLVGGTLWSAWKMRGAPQLRDRFVGTLLIALGATVVAAGSAFALNGLLIGFSATLAAGVALMFLGFLRASRPPRTAPYGDPPDRAAGVVSPSSGEAVG